MALAYAIQRTISSSSFLLSKVCGATYKCSFTCGNILSKKLSIAEELNLPEPPSKPQQPFVKFMSMGHKELTNLTWSERIQKLSAAWNNQTQEEKTRRLEEYYGEKKEYQQKYHQYLNQLSPEQLNSIKRVQERRKQSKETMLAKKEKKKELERLGKPKNPENCFVVFAVKLQRPDDMIWKDFLPYAGSKWKELSEDERNRYKDDGRARAEKYEAEMTEWEKKMLAEGRWELVRRRTYQVYQTSDHDGHRKQSSRSNDDDAENPKSGQSIPNVRQHGVDCGQESTITHVGQEGVDCGGQESNLTQIGIRERPRARKPSTVIISGDSHSTSSSDTIISKSRAGAAKTPAKGINASLNQRMVSEKHFPDSQTEFSTNDSALVRDSHSGARGKSVGTPQGYVTLGSRPLAQQRNAMFTAAFPDEK